MMRDRIITPIPFLSFAITKETTKSKARLEFVCVHEAKEEQNKQIKKIEGDDSQEVTQRDAHTKSDYG